jgi:hypothetical protein
MEKGSQYQIKGLYATHVIEGGGTAKIFRIPLWELLFGKCLSTRRLNNVKMFHKLARLIFFLKIFYIY